MRTLAASGLATTGLRRFEIVVAIENERSQRVAEKAGAAREGILKARLWLYEFPHDAVVYSLVRKESLRSPVVSRPKTEDRRLTTEP